MPGLFYNDNLSQHLAQSGHLIQGIVMHRAHAHHPAAFFQSQPLCHRQSIVVAVPHINAGISQLFSHFTGVAVLQA